MSDSDVRSAQRVIETLSAYGIQFIFGVPGAKIDPVYDALADGGPELVVCRHEQNAAFMAAAVGRLTGTPGVALVTSGPGTTNLATGLITATTEQDPMVAICGAVQRADRLKRTHQSMDAVAALKPFTKYTGEVNDPDNVPEAIANAIRIALTAPHGAAAVVLPADVLAASTPAAIVEPLPVPALGPAPADRITQAVNLIRAAQRPVLFVGIRVGEPEPCAALRKLLAVTDLPVVETFQAAGVVSRELEDHFVGRVGLFRNQPGDIVIGHADVLVTVGYDPGGIGLRPADGGAHQYYGVGVEHIAFEVDTKDEVDDAHARATSSGAKIHFPAEEDRDEPGYYAFFAFDPDGIRIEIFSWTPTHGQS